jgi:hypothetical protein
MDTPINGIGLIVKQQRRALRRLKTRMTGAYLRAFASGRISDADARAQGYDPDAVRKFHKIPKPVRRSRERT